LCSEYLKQKAFFSPKILRKAPTHSQKQDPKKKTENKKEKRKKKKEKKEQNRGYEEECSKKNKQIQRRGCVFARYPLSKFSFFFFSPDDQSWYFITDGTLNTKPLVGTTRILPFSQSQGLLQEPKQDKQKTKTQTKKQKRSNS